MNRKRPSLIPAIVFMAILLVAAVVFFILAAVQERGTDNKITFNVVAVIALVFGLGMLAFIFMIKSRDKHWEQNFSNPDSIANKVMGEGTKFAHFVIIPNAKSQKWGNVAANVAGIASAAVFGAGVIEWGKDTLDAYVSDDELIINTQNSANFDDSNFTCYPSSEIENVTFESLPRYERVTVLLSGNRGMCFDISTSGCPSEYIRAAFGALAGKREEPAEVFPEMN